MTSINIRSRLTLRLFFCSIAAFLACGTPATPVQTNSTSNTREADASAFASASTKRSAATEDQWLLAYFRQRYDGRVEIDADGRTRVVPLQNPMKEESLHFALSRDGRHWTPLNGNRPVWDHWLRDPFVRRDPDGLWRLLGTGGARGARRNPADGPTCLYALSHNLVTWEEPRSLTLMQGVRDDSGRLARNILAPEWCVDPATGDFFVFWSSSFEDAGWKKSRLWFARTRDWKTFTQAKELFAPSYSVIDGTLLQHEGTWYLFHKEEEFGAITGERRAIRLAVSKTIEGPYTIHDGPLNGGQIVPVITEGPSVMPDPLKPGWLLLYDYCMSNDYGVSSSTDLVHWSIEQDVVLPPDARHGSVSRLTAAEASALRKAFPGESNK